MKLTAKNVRTEGITNDKDEQIYFDDKDTNFGLRLRKRGDGTIARTLIFQFGRYPKITIGAVDKIEFGKARKTAKGHYATALKGEDPSRDKKEAKASSAETFGAFLPRFLTHARNRLRPRTYPDLERHLNIKAKSLHDLPLAKITRRDIAAVTSAVAEEAGDTTSNRVRTSLSAYFAWLMGEGLVDVNPVVGTTKREERKRERILSPDELRLIWAHAGDDHYAAIIRLLALTGARADEIASLCWSEVRDNLIVLPPDRVKNGRTHEIPLSAAARAIIEGQPRRANLDGKPRDLIFGTGDGAFSGWSNCKHRLNERIKKATGKALPHWTPHDLRRSFSTHANELGLAQPHIIETVLGHVSGFRAGVAGVYNHASYRNEKRIALDRWADRLLAWIEGRTSNVTALRRPA
jgi:integrase